MTFDEQRKRIFELESGLGTAIKISEQLKDALIKQQTNNKKLADAFECLSAGIKTYLRTMKKEDLIRAVDNTKTVFVP